MKIYSFGLLVCLALSGCASDESHEHERFGNSVDTSSTSKADGDAYVTDAMTIDKWEPIREPTSDPFYFKTCNQVDEKTFYSMTSYDCTQP